MAHSKSPESAVTHEWMESLRHDIDTLKEELLKRDMLLSQIGELIRVRDGNFRKTANMCMFCNMMPSKRVMVRGYPVSKPTPCIHSEIWGYGHIRPESD